MGNFLIYRSVVGARFGHSWGTKLKFRRQFLGKVGARGMMGAQLGHGWPLAVGAWLIGWTVGASMLGERLGHNRDL